MHTFNRLKCHTASKPKKRLFEFLKGNFFTESLICHSLFQLSSWFVLSYFQIEFSPNFATIFLSRGYMKICRFTSAQYPSPVFGTVDNGFIQPLSGEPYTGIVQQGDKLEIASVKFWAPVAPSKIVCVGRNYREHAAELGNPLPSEPLLFLKAPSSLIGPEEAILLPPVSRQVEHEGELGVVIGKTASQLTDLADPLAYVFGYTCLNDVTARDIQRQDVQFTRGKSFDTFCPVGPFVVTGINPLALDLTTRLNGKITQQGNTKEMAFAVPSLIRYISRAMTLFPGDLIATGTPAGVTRMIPGDSVEVEINGIGILRNSISTL
jgi:2-keto-4-pentenoate hydratase/2-oxohepta-3-ene-1,7-dioic acid hydratase in catechol pathway